MNYNERCAMEARHRTQMLRIAHQHTRIINTDLEADRAGIDARMYPSTFGLRARLVPPQSPSGLRTRRSELVRSDLFVDSGERGETSTGRAAVVWAVVRIERREEVAS